MTLFLTSASQCSLRDMSPRLREALTSADVVLAAEVAEPARLLAELGDEVAGRAISYRGELPALTDSGDDDRYFEIWDQSEVARALDHGVVVAMADRGDAAASLARRALELGVTVTVVPGPDPVVAAVTMSGLPSERFCYEGALARSSPARGLELAELETERRTMVFLLEPGRRAEVLADLVAAFGNDRQAALCRGLARSSEQVCRAQLGELVSRCPEAGHEEVLLVVRGASASPRSEPSSDDLAEAAADLVRNGATSKAAIAAVADRLDVRKRVVYEAVIKAKERGVSPGGYEHAGEHR